MVFWDYVTRLEEETRRLVRCYCSKEMNEEFPACTDRGGFALPARYTAARNPAHSR